MYELVKTDGVEAAIAWFKANGKRAAWGGSHWALAQQLISDGRIEDGLRLMESDIEMTPKKVWLLRKTSRAFLDNGRPEQALNFLQKGLELRPDDESFNTMKAEAEKALEDKI